jgi:hypothetical protein
MDNKTKEIFEKKVNVSILDWLGELKDGVSVMLSLNILDESYYMIYWFNPNEEYILIIDDEFLEKYKIDNIYNYPYFKDLKNYIDFKILPSREEIWDEFKIT